MQESSSPRRVSLDDEEGAEKATAEEKEAEEAQLRSAVSSATERRFLRWTKEDVFDFNPEYASSLRGILNILEIVVSGLVMVLVGAGCAYPYSKGTTYFFCPSTAACLFVLASASFVHSFLMAAACLVSKKGDAILAATNMEVVYYIVFFLLFLISGATVETKLDPRADGFQIFMAGGVFGLTNALLFFISAVWYFKLQCFKDDSNENFSRSPRPSSGDSEGSKEVASRT